MAKQNAPATTPTEMATYVENHLHQVWPTSEGQPNFVKTTQDDMQLVPESLFRVQDS